MASQSASAPVKSAMRTLDILELAAGRSGPVTAHEIAITLGIPVSSLSYLLSTLVERGYLERDRREYRLGPAIARFRPPEDEPSLAERVGPIVRALTRELNETAGFFVLRDFELEAVASEIGLHALRYSLEVGQRAPLHALAAGKAILAGMSEAQLELYFRTVRREAYTPQTIHDETGLREAIADVRRKGVARTREEYSAGISGVARAAIVGGVTLGAFSIAIPIARLNKDVERRAVQLLGRAVNLLRGSEADGGRPDRASGEARR